MTKQNRKVLVIDVGGTNVKIKVTSLDQWRATLSGAEMMTQQMVDAAVELAQGWAYDVVSTSSGAARKNPAQTAKSGKRFWPHRRSDSTGKPIECAGWDC